jgi:solute:Na+ symporter, SSS family
MAGVAANVSAFNTVVTYDLYQDYIRRDADAAHYIRFGRIATVVGIAISISTAFIAKGYENIMTYVQLLFSYFNAPLFATFIIGMSGSGRRRGAASRASFRAPLARS